MKITFDIGRTSFGLDFKRWKRCKAERGVSSYVVLFGPIFYVKSGLEFSREAASRMFHQMNNGPVGNLARMYHPT